MHALKNEICYRYRYATTIPPGVQLDRYGFVYFHHGAQVFTNSINTVLEELHLQTVNNIDIPAHYIVTMPTEKTGTCTLHTLCIYEVQVNEILVTQNPHLVILPAIH